VPLGQDRIVPIFLSTLAIQHYTMTFPGSTGVFDYRY
jgi:hypothetical protein